MTSNQTKKIMKMNVLIESSAALVVSLLVAAAVCPAQSQQAGNNTYRAEPQSPPSTQGNSKQRDAASPGGVPANTVQTEKPGNAPEALGLAATMKAGGYTPIPLTSKSSHYFIELVIGGDKGRFLLDSGAMASVLYEASVAKFKIEMEAANLDAIGVGGSGKIKSIARTKSLACGALSGMTQRFYITPSAAGPGAGDDYWDGVLGADFLQSHAGIIDFSSHTVWLRAAPGTPVEPSGFIANMNSLGFAAAKFTVQDNHLFVDGSIGDAKARLLLDSGAVVSMFKKSAVEKFTMTVIKGRAVIVGLGGPEEIHALAKTQELHIGSGDAVSQEFYVLEMANLPKEFITRFDGILGYDFFAKKNALIDYANSALWLPRSPGSK